MRTREQRGYQMFPVLDGARVETALPQAARWLPCRSSRDRGAHGIPCRTDGHSSCRISVGLCSVSSRVCLTSGWS